MARPRLPIEYHLIRGSYRRDRHGPLPETSPNPAASPPEPDPLDTELGVELEKWAMTFRCGRDFFNATNLNPYSVRGTQAEEDAARRRFHRAARSAWRRLGKRFMAQWQPDHDRARVVPWAYERLGPP